MSTLKMLIFSAQFMYPAHTVQRRMSQHTRTVHKSLLHCSCFNQLVGTLSVLLNVHHLTDIHSNPLLFPVSMTFFFKPLQLGFFGIQRKNKKQKSEVKFFSQGSEQCASLAEKICKQLHERRERRAFQFWSNLWIGSSYFRTDHTYRKLNCQRVSPYYKLQLSYIKRMMLSK